MKDPSHLVVIDTQKVKGYVFGTRYLREVRGASLLLDRLNRVETRKLLPSDAEGVEVVYLGGGSGRVLFADAGAARVFADRVAELYRRGTVDARVAVEVVTRAPGESFPDWMARGVARSRHAQAGRGRAVPLLGGRWIRPCTSCGRHAAETFRRDVQGIHQLCSSCLLKREEIRDFYRWPKHNQRLDLPIPTFRTLARTLPDALLTRLAGAMEERFGDGARVLLPQDFDQIGETSRPRGYFGFVYADGNQMGKTLRAMAEAFRDEAEARAAYLAFSEIVDRATREAAVEAVIGNVAIEPATTADGESAHLVPAEFLIAGGDDLLLALPAQAALPAVARFVELFQRKTRELQEERVADGRLARPFASDGLTLSAGVVLSHSSYPASQLLELARDLMKLAKRDAARRAGAMGTVDFMVLHEPGSDRPSERRAREYEETLTHDAAYFADFQPPTGRLRRTERPYTCDGLRKLCERVRALRAAEVPRGKLEALYAALFQGWTEARYDASRIAERLRVTGDLDTPVLRELFDELRLFPFRPVDGGWSTPLTEIVELYDFVTGEPGGGVDA